MFCRLCELGKLQIKTTLRDKREEMLNPAVRKVKNKSGVIETRAYTCADCSEEYCNGRTCMEFNYDLYTRITPKDPSKAAAAAKALETAASGGGHGEGKKIKKKSKSLDADKGKSKKRNRSKSPSKKSSQSSKSNKK